MNDFNFNNIDNLEIPDSWADKAIEIAKKPKPIPFFKTTKFLAFAASLVLVCGVSFAMYFIVGINEDPIVSPVEPTDASSYTETLETKPQKETEKNQEETRKPTDSSVGSYETIEPTELRPDSTDKPSESNQKPTKPQQPTPGETEKPTKPTEDSSEPSVDTPSEPPFVIPSTPPMDDIIPSNISVSVTIYKHLVLDDEKIYCKVYDENGVLLGDPNVFSNEHLSELSYMSYYMAYYYPYRHSLITKSGNYTFVFYNSNGEVAREITEFMEYYP